MRWLEFPYPLKSAPDSELFVITGLSWNAYISIQQCLVEISFFLPVWGGLVKGFNIHCCMCFQTLYLEISHQLTIIRYLSHLKSDLNRILYWCYNLSPAVSRARMKENCCPWCSLLLWPSSSALERTTSTRSMWAQSLPECRQSHKTEPKGKQSWKEKDLRLPIFCGWDKIIDSANQQNNSTQSEQLLFIFSILRSWYQ